ncbi:MAG: UDP-3-O-acyl-N-acetylglucosamine deacetylase, partial [Paracoccaceae bacterium]|nr:UDP-3-O-acyl-N-acetylglucosamine deacetylase [Paracoccaceae bacterium]
LKIKPSAAQYGIWFRRTDINTKDNMIAAHYLNVSESELCTTLSNESGVTISTVEHLMAAFAGCGIQNALVEVDGPEIPIMDGSSDWFVRKIISAGTKQLIEPLRVIHVKKEISVKTDNSFASITPFSELSISFEIDFEDEAIGYQKKSLNMANGSFVKELCNSRTFCRNSDVEAMKKNGLALGGSLDNAIVVSGEKVLNPEGFRYTDECVRHKMLDVLGDLALAGVPIIGAFKGSKSGHSLTNKLLRKLFSDSSAFEMTVCSEKTASVLPGVGIVKDDLPSLY